MKTILGFSAIALVALLAYQPGTSPDPATAFLASLDAEQRETAQHAFDDMSREEWHFFPVSMWPRAGISLAKLNDSQEQLLFALLRENLSASGYDKTRRIIDLENVLAELEGNSAMRDPEQYHVAFYGDPAKDRLWGWSFEGHHLSLNFTVVDGEISMAPRFLGANPAIVLSGTRKGERTLAREADLGFALINALSAEQRQKAIFREDAFPDIVTSHASEVKPLDLAGIPLQEMSRAQQTILSELLMEYISAMPGDLAAKRMQNLREEEWGEIYFGWAGATKPGAPHYYRIQGRTFLVEFDNIQDNANHIHTVWRDFDGDFGRDLLREHYERDHR